MKLLLPPPRITVIAVLAAVASTDVNAFSASSFPTTLRTQTALPAMRDTGADDIESARAALEALMRKSGNGDSSVDQYYNNGQQQQQQDNGSFAVFEDESDAPTPLQELEQQNRNPQQFAFARRSHPSPQHQQHPSYPQQPHPNRRRPQPHLLTSAGRRQRELEMDLIRALMEDTEDTMADNKMNNQHEHEKNDKKKQSAVNELMHLWMYEMHNAEAAQQLESMEEQCSPGLLEEMKQLERMIADYPSWAEPRSRLATLLYFKGRTAESYEMALQALDLKPWHFECLHLLVLLSLRMQDFGLALYWARQGLPPMRYRAVPATSSGGHHETGEMGTMEPFCSKRRAAWVERALKMATEQLQQAEEETARALHAKSRRGQRINPRLQNHPNMMMNRPTGRGGGGTGGGRMPPPSPDQSWQ